MTNPNYQEPYAEQKDDYDIDQLIKKSKAFINSPHARRSRMMSLALEFCQSSGPVSRLYFSHRGTFIF